MKNVHHMDRLELETELIERRLQVQNLIQEIKRKDSYIEKYSDFYDKLMKKERIKKRTKEMDKNNKEG